MELPKSLAERRSPHASFSIPCREKTEVATNTDSPHSDAGPERSLSASLVVERFVLTRERRWSVGISSVIAASLGLLLGFSIAFASNAILDLAGEAPELPSEYLFPTSLLSVFIVSIK